MRHPGGPAPVDAPIGGGVHVTRDAGRGEIGDLIVNSLTIRRAFEGAA